MLEYTQGKGFFMDLNFADLTDEQAQLYTNILKYSPVPILVDISDTIRRPNIYPYLREALKNNIAMEMSPASAKFNKELDRLWKTHKINIQDAKEDIASINLKVMHTIGIVQSNKLDTVNYKILDNILPSPLIPVYKFSNPTLLDQDVMSIVEKYLGADECIRLNLEIINPYSRSSAWSNLESLNTLEVDTPLNNNEMSIIEEYLGKSEIIRINIEAHATYMNNIIKNNIILHKIHQSNVMIGALSLFTNILKSITAKDYNMYNGMQLILEGAYTYAIYNGHTTFRAGAGIMDIANTLYSESYIEAMNIVTNKVITALAFGTVKTYAPSYVLLATSIGLTIYNGYKLANNIYTTIFNDNNILEMDPYTAQDIYTVANIEECPNYDIFDF